MLRFSWMFALPCCFADESTDRGQLDAPVAGPDDDAVVPLADGARGEINHWGVRLAQLAEDPRSDQCSGFYHVYGPAKGLWFGGDAWNDLRLLEESLAAIRSFREYYVDELFADTASVLVPNLEPAVEDCAGGVVTALAYGLPHLNRVWGDTVVPQFARVVLFLLAALRARKATGWDVLKLDGNSPRFAPNFWAWPKLLGAAALPPGWPRPPTSWCHDALKVFVHRAGGTEHALKCSTGLRSTEVWFHNLLLSSGCTVDRAEDAKFILLPFYSVCMHLKRQSWRPMGFHPPFIRPYYELSEQLVAIFEHAARLSGRPGDILLLLPEEKWPLLDPALLRRPSSRRPRLLVTEARPVHCTHWDRVRVENASLGFIGELRCEHCYDCFRPGHDVVVPSFVDHFTRARLLEGNMPHKTRPTLVAYYGGGPGWTTDGSYGEVVNHREKLADLAALKKREISVGGYQDDYEWLLGQARFCLVPKGLGYWTHRLYEVMLAGCIPVILSDHVVLPFQGLHGVDWTKFSVKWPEDCIGEDLYDWLAAYGRKRGAEMKQELDAVACWFDYHAEGPCNAMAAALESLGAPPAPRLPPFWNAPHSLWLRPTHNCTAASFDHIWD